ncbi:MAG: hypothetical protein LBB91_09530 [Clostridiales bacterium]|jgi:uncharacterized membrane protein YraQ (UPF0718 family)|nr:hypothetical protein [Clostridiales bacterium]
MIEILNREAVYLWFYFSIQFEQIFQYYVIGIAIGSIISVFGKQKINQLAISLQKKKMGVFGVIPASILGIISHFI